MFGLDCSWGKDAKQQTVGHEETAAFVKEAPPYLLGPKDKVRVRAVEWRASRGEVFEWKVVNLEYVVDAAGSISVPLVGDIPATGMTKMALSKAISERLRANLGLASSLDVTVEIVECRPFYVMGDVSKPGEYSYRPGMTVLQAVSIAGGYLTQRNPRESINDENELHGALLALNELSARKDRLMAELSGRSLEFSMRLRPGNDPAWQSSLVQETWIFDANREAERKELRSLQELKDFYDRETSLLENQLQLNAKTVELSALEMSDVATLVKKGLTTRQREIEVGLQSAQRESERLRLQSELIKVRQELSKTLTAITQIESKRRIRAASDLRNTQAEMNRMEDKAGLKSKLLINAGGDAAARRTFKIVRQTDAGTKELDVSDKEAM